MRSRAYWQVCSCYFSAMSADDGQNFWAHTALLDENDNNKRQQQKSTCELLAVQPHFFRSNDELCSL